MRTYGRIRREDGSLYWVKVQTDANGLDDYVWLTTLAQCLKLILGESPFFANYGIPSQQAVLQQIFPDFDVSKTQAQFSAKFAVLIVAKVPDRQPIYRINIITNAGVKLNVDVAA